jgi:hypothetical protein
MRRLGETHSREESKENAGEHERMVGHGASLGDSTGENKR